MATHSSILAWQTPWTEKPGRLQSMGSQRVKHDQATEHTHTHTWDSRSYHFLSTSLVTLIMWAGLRPQSLTQTLQSS